MIILRSITCIVIKEQPLKIKYQTPICPMSHDELVKKLRAALHDKRFYHVLRVEKTAVSLAKIYGVNVEKASIAGLCHDYAKQRPDEDFIKVIKDKGLNSDLLNYGNAIWHGIVGAEMVKDELGICDEDILNAIRQHTTGAPQMTKLAQIVYMADYIEPARDFDGVDKARQLAKTDLAAAVAYQTKSTLLYLLKQGVAVYPQTLATYNAWVPKNERKIE